MSMSPLHFRNVAPLAPPSGGARPAKPASAQPNREQFSRVLEQELLQARPITLSAHAQQRLSARNIMLAKAQYERLAGAVDRAAAKGAHDSLIMVDDVALVVNVPNRTVVTAMGKRDLHDAVFTKIDSAVIA